MGIYQAYSLVESILAAQGGDSDILAAIFGVKAEYLEESFDEMQKRYGAIENYFAEVLGIHAARQKALRDQEVAGQEWSNPSLSRSAKSSALLQPTAAGSLVVRDVSYKPRLMRRKSASY